MIAEKQRTAVLSHIIAPKEKTRGTLVRRLQQHSFTAVAKP